MFNLNDWLSNTLVTKKFEIPVASCYYVQEIRPRIACKDGLTLSVQASHGHYCLPREDGKQYYTEVEVGYPSMAIEELLSYAEDVDNPTDTVYAYVPTKVVEFVINKHGGIA